MSFLPNPDGFAADGPEPTPEQAEAVKKMLDAVIGIAGVVNQVATEKGMKAAKEFVEDTIPEDEKAMLIVGMVGILRGIGIIR